TEIARNAWGRTGSSAGEHDAAKAAVHRLAEHTGGQGQRKDNGERFHGKPPDGIVPLRQANRGTELLFLRSRSRRGRGWPRSHGSGSGGGPWPAPGSGAPGGLGVGVSDGRGGF